MKITVQPIEPDRRREPPSDFGFGNTFTNHMFKQTYTKGEGWHDAAICPYEALSLMPATATLHYGQAFFEGLKAYRRPDGNINLFRPWENMKRFNRSAVRLAAPEVDEEEHLDALIKLIEMDHEWVPSADGASLYIRPFMFASEAALGVHASHEYMHLIILSPVGFYFTDGLTPISVFISDKYRRAVLGGTGDIKAAGNYAASLYVSEEVAKQGYSQVLWLDAIHGRYVEEVGAMNIAFVYGDHIVTPALSGSILPGVTRDSILKLAPDLGYTVEEASIDITELLTDIKAGKVTEAFGIGTAAVVIPVGNFGYQGEDYSVNGIQVGPVTEHLFKALTDIQFGRVPDERGWTLTIETP